MAIADLGSILDFSKVSRDQLVRISPRDNWAKNITITWNIGKRCNFACSYCWKDLHDKTSPHRSFEELLKAWLRLRDVVGASGQPARIIFTGGEPTLNPDFARFVGFLAKTQRRWVGQMGMTTNGTESYEYYRDLLADMDFISFSTHFEWWEESQFMSVLLDLWRSSGRNKRGKWINVNLMYENWGASSIERIRNVLLSEAIPWTSYKIINFYGSKGIANPITRDFDYAAYLAARGEEAGAPGEAAIGGSEQLNIGQALVDDQTAGNEADIEIELSDGTLALGNSMQMVNFELANFPGWECHVQNSLYIHNDGVLWAGNCKFADLGNVYESFRSLGGPVTCDGRLCVCPIDVQIEKSRPRNGQAQPVQEQFRRATHDRKPKNS